MPTSNAPSPCSKLSWTDAPLASAVAGARGARACSAQLLRWLMPFTAAAAASALAAQAAVVQRTRLRQLLRPRRTRPRRTRLRRASAAAATGGACSTSRRTQRARSWPAPHTSRCSDTGAGRAARVAPDMGRCARARGCLHALPRALRLTTHAPDTRGPPARSRRAFPRSCCACASRSPRWCCQQQRCLGCCAGVVWPLNAEDVHHRRGGQLHPPTHVRRLCCCV